MKLYLGSTCLDCAPPYIYDNVYDNYVNEHGGNHAQRPTTQTQNLPAGETKCPIPFRMPVAVQ
jgi:hypothetical protein